MHDIVDVHLGCHHRFPQDGDDGGGNDLTDGISDVVEPARDADGEGKPDILFGEGNERPKGEAHPGPVDDGQRDRHAGHAAEHRGQRHTVQRVNTQGCVMEHGQIVAHDVDQVFRQVDDQRRVGVAHGAAQAGRYDFHALENHHAAHDVHIAAGIAGGSGLHPHDEKQGIGPKQKQQPENHAQQHIGRQRDGGQLDHAPVILHADGLVDAHDGPACQGRSDDLAQDDVLVGHADRADHAVGQPGQECHVDQPDGGAQDAFQQNRQSQLPQADVFRSQRLLLFGSPQILLHVGHTLSFPVKKNPDTSYIKRSPSSIIRDKIIFRKKLF